MGTTDPARIRAMTTPPVDTTALAALQGRESDGLIQSLGQIRDTVALLQQKIRALETPTPTEAP